VQNKRLFLWSLWKEREREREGGVVGEGRKEGRKEGGKVAEGVVSFAVFVGFGQRRRRRIWFGVEEGDGYHAEGGVGEVDVFRADAREGGCRLRAITQ
jgi:hypothetical protein